MFVQNAISILGEHEVNADHLRELEPALDKIVPFVGAGFSASFGYPGWGRFLEGLCPKPEPWTEVHEEVEANRFEEAAEIAEKHLKEHLNESIRNVLSEDRLPFPLPDAAVLRLPQITRGPVLTTNFDPVLEVVFRRAGRPFSDTFAGDQIKDASAGLQSRHRFLLKLHGDYRSQFSRILTLSEYNRAYGVGQVGQIDWSRPLPKVLRQAITGNTMLFLGCSLVNDRTTAIIAGAGEELPGVRHYALLSSSENTAKRREELKRWKILPLFYPDSRYEKIGEFLDCVARALDPKTPTQVVLGPRYLTSFVGRGVEMRDVIDRLKGLQQIVTITGPAGTGKTRLVREVLTHIVSDFSDGAVFIGLEDLAQYTLVLPTIAEKLGLRKRSSETPTDQSLTDMIKDYLRPRQMLLVLDNFEQVIEASASVVELASACEQLRILITSRERLNFQSQSELALEPLSLPASDQTDDVESIRRHSAVELFAARARAGSPEFRITAENVHTVLEICRRLDGLPLAIELAAAKLRSRPLEWVAGQLNERLPFLTHGGVDISPRQRTMENAISWSYELLTPEEQAAFQKLSVFAGSFDLFAAMDIAEPADENLLESLADKSMLKREPFDSAPRYRMLGIIQEYAYERLEDEADIEQRYMRYFLSVAFAHLGRRKQGDEEQAYDWIRREIPNLRGVLDRSVETDPGLGLQLCVLLRPYWLDLGYVNEGRKRLSDLINTLQPTIRALGEKEQRHSWFSAISGLFGDRESAWEGGPWVEVPDVRRVDAQHLAAILALIQNDYDASRGYLEAIKALGEKYDDEQLTRSAAVPLAFLATRDNDSDEPAALRTLRENLETSGPDRHNPQDLMLAAAKAIRRKDFVTTNSLLQQAYDSAPAKDSNLRCSLLAGLAHVAALEGRRTEAIALCARAEDIANQTGIAMLRAMTLMMTGGTFENLGGLSAAKSRYDEALAIAEKVGMVWFIASVASRAGENDLRQGMYGQAKKHFERLEAVGHQLGSSQYVGNAILGISRAEIGLRQRPRRLAEALEYIRKVKTKPAEAVYLSVLGDGELLMAKYDEALKTFEQARAAFEKVGDFAGVGHSLLRMGNAHRERGEYEEAKKKYGEAETVYRDNRLNGGVLNCMRAQGDLYKRQRKFDEAQKVYEEALKLARENKDAQGEANLLLALGDLFADTKQ